jgi:hypothetical protein
MKVKIEKDNKVQEFNLITEWKDVSLETYGKLIDYKEGNNSQEALHMIKAMSDIPKRYAKALRLSDVSTILSKVATIQALDKGAFEHIIRIDEVNYGFHPNLDEITLGEYADIEHFIGDDYMKNLDKIMAVLYRPITKRNGQQYSIEAYDGNIEGRVKILKKMSAKQVQGALVFFWSFASVLLKSIQLYLMEVNLKELTQD